MNLRESLTTQITSIYNPADYSTVHEALIALETLAKDKSMPETVKIAFNNNFYNFLRSMCKHFGESDLVDITSKGIAHLASMTAEQRERVNLIGDETKFSFALIDGSERYMSAWVPETGKTRFPSQFIHFLKVVLLNDLDKVVKS